MPRGPGPLPSHTFSRAFLPGPNLTGRKLPHGLLIEAAHQPHHPAASAAPGFESPFKILDATDDPTEETPEPETKAQIVDWSVLFLSSDDPTDTLDLDDLDYEFPVAVNDHAWVEVTIEDRVATSARVRMGDPAVQGWDNFPQPYDHAGFEQTKAFILIARFDDETETDYVSINIVGLGENKLRAVQFVVTHLLLADIAFGATTFVGAVAWPGSDAPQIFSNPFRILDASTEEDGVQAQVNDFSLLFLGSDDVTDTMSITTLATPFAVAAGDWAWLEVGVEDGAAMDSGTQVRIGEPSAFGWANFPTPYDFVGSAQTKLFIPIASFHDMDTTERVSVHTVGSGELALRVKQIVLTHLLLTPITQGRDRYLGAVAWPGNDLPEPVRLPFAVSDASYGGTTAIKVALNSSLLDSIKFDDTIDIDHLDEALDCAAGDYVILKYDRSAGTAEIEVVSTWDGFPEPIEWEDPDAETLVQKYARVVIARIVESPVADDIAAITIAPPDDPADTLDVVQLVFTGLLVAQTCYGGVNVRYPMPWHSAKL